MKQPGFTITQRNNESGMALILVLSILTMLLVIATPFVLQTKKDYRNAVSSAEDLRARSVAESALGWAKMSLEQTHQGLEYAKKGHAEHRYDSPDEFRVDAHPENWNALLGVTTDFPFMGNPRQDLWSIKVREEQSFINADTAPPFVWAALVGRTTLSGPVELSATELEVASTVGFKPKAGQLVINGDLIDYRQAKDGKFSGVKLLRKYPEGAWVENGLAYDLARYNYKSPAAQGRDYIYMANTTAVKEVAGYGQQAIAEHRLDDILAPITIRGWRYSPAGWMTAERVSADVDPDAFQEKNGQRVRVFNSSPFSPGTVVKLSDGGRIFYSLVKRVRDGVVYLEDQVDGIYPYGTTSLSAELRHPVNINNCSERILMILLEGLEFDPQGVARPQNPHRVDAATAAALAEIIVKNRPVRGIEHLVHIVSVFFHVQKGSYVASKGGVDAQAVAVKSQGTLTFSEKQAAAVIANAINPNDFRLVRGTMPFCYASRDYFSVEAASSINDGGGTERARFRLRETFRSAPAAELMFGLQTQADFEDSILATRSGRRVVSHPNPVSYFTGERRQPADRLLRMLDRFGDPSGLGIFPSGLEGDVRLDPARLYGGTEEHFDGRVDRKVAGNIGTQGANIPTEFVGPEGYPLTSGAFLLDSKSGSTLSKGTGGSGSRRTSSALKPMAGQDGMNPFAVEFFVKPAQFSSAPVFFSAVGQDPVYDTVRCYYDPADKSFHFKVHDNTIDDPRYQGVEAAELVWSPDPAMIEDDTWYHLSLHVFGTRPGEISLFVDGFKRGKAKMQSPLTGGFSENDTSFSVEDAEDWPESGPFQIGVEIVHAYRDPGTNTFQVFDNPNGAAYPGSRGVRGSEVMGHPQGEMVRPFGYSAVVRHETLPADEVITEGGGSLASALAPFDFGAIEGTKVEVVALQTGTGGGPPTQISGRVIDLATETSMKLIAMGNSSVGSDAFQTTGGYALIFGLIAANPNSPPQPGAIPYAAQLIRYGSRNGDTLENLTVVSNTYNSAVADGTDLGAIQPGTNNNNRPSVKIYTTTKQKFITQLTAGGPNAPILSFVMPISVHLTANEGYREPDLNASGVPYYEYLQLGQPLNAPDFSNFSSHLIEWIRYGGVDRTNNIFFVNARQDLINGIRGVAGAYVDPTTNMGYANINDQGDQKATPRLAASTGLGLRRRANTAQFGWDDIANAGHTHPQGDSAIPAFRMATMASIEAAAGYGDSVTLVSKVDGVRERLYVSWAYQGLVAFTQDVSNRITQIALPNQSQRNAIPEDYTRLLKFPSGELPRITAGGDFYLGGDVSSNQNAGGYLDEVRVHSLDRQRFVLWDDDVIDPVGGPPSPIPLGVDDSATEIPVVNAYWIPNIPVTQVVNNPQNLAWLPDSRELAIDANISLPNYVGLVQIDDEIIAYRSHGSGPNGLPALLDCQRGVLGTLPAEHSFGASVVFLDWRMVSVLNTNVDPRSYTFPVTTTQGFQRNGGTFLINQEMVHYTLAAGSSFQMPYRTDRQRGEDTGLFRGRYGSEQGSHSQDSLIFDMPFRYWDRYAENSDDPELSFYEFAVNEPRAFFRRLSWHTKMTKARLNVKMLCRLDPTVAWDTPPELSGGRLLLLDSQAGRAENQLNQKLLNMSGKGMEVRVFFCYERRAIDTLDMRVNDWKETPHLLDLSLSYLAAPFVMSRETLK